MNQLFQHDFEWLMTSEALPLLRQAEEQFTNGTNVVSIAKSLRKSVTPERAAIVMEQAQLRLRGLRKFSKALDMFFTRKGLEQSTSETISLYKASRFQGKKNLIDVCCGIGGDSLGLRQRVGAESTLGIDNDPLSAMFTQHNANLYGLGRSGVFQSRLQSFSELDLGASDAIHCDPDRRANDRTVLGSRFSPSMDEIFSRVRTTQQVAIKVAPATPASEDWPTNIEREWIGDRRECKQQVIWQGCESGDRTIRKATVVDGEVVFSLVGGDDATDMTIEISREIRNFLFEPHPTVLASGLTNLLATNLGLARIDIDIDYLTGNLRSEHPLISCFEVIEAFPMNIKRTAAILNRFDVGRIELKNRGASKVAYDKYHRLRLSGRNQATVILTRIGLQQWVAICRRNPTDFPI